MSQVLVEVRLTALPEDDDFVLHQLTEDLVDDPRRIGEVSRIESGRRDRKSKGLAETRSRDSHGSTGTDPRSVQAMIDLVVAFLNRNAGRRVHLKAGDIELSFDGPTNGQTAGLIAVVCDAIECSR